MTAVSAIATHWTRQHRLDIKSSAAQTVEIPADSTADQKDLLQYSPQQLKKPQPQQKGKPLPLVAALPLADSGGTPQGGRAAHHVSK